MDILEIVKKSDEATCKEVLGFFLEKYLHPAFGSLPKREIDLIVIEVLEKLKIIEPDPSIYTYVQKLRVTRSKARNLLYDLGLRRLNQSELDLKVKDALKKPLIQKQGELFALEIESPLVSDHLRSIVKDLGHVTDGSFSPSLVKLNDDAFIALMSHYIDDDQKDTLRKALVKAGAPDTSFNGVLKAVFKKLAEKFVDRSGEALVDKVSDYLGPIVDGAIGKCKDLIPQLFTKKNEDNVSIGA
jgi:hypothetical protein